MRRRRRAREKQEKTENRRPISKKLRAVLLRSFRGQHGEKLFCARREPEVTGIFSKAYSPKRSRGPRHHVEAAVDLVQLT